ncbi:MAG: hypothetical protein PHF25_08440 [Candidatus Margulisbacteria bacterium]|nr:hypothetical protein [Candidatus Margulisiibacteriota bacterium]
MADEQEISLANGLFSRFMNVFDVKEYEYAKEYLYFRFNAYGHLLQIKLLKAGSLKDLIIETEDVLRLYNDVLNSLGIRGIEKFSKEIKEKFGFISADFNAISYLYKEKTDAYKNVISRIFFLAETSSLKIEVSADMKHISINLKSLDIMPSQFIKEFASSYQKLSVDLYELHKEIMDIIKDENMSHNAIEHFVFTKGVRGNEDGYKRGNI